MWMQQQYDLLKKSYFNVSYRRCMPRTLAWRRARLDHACQSGNMAILLTSLLFVFEILFLPKYRVNYYDCIIKWCFGVCIPANSPSLVRSLRHFRLASISVRGDRNLRHLSIGFFSSFFSFSGHHFVFSSDNPD